MSSIEMLIEKGILSSEDSRYRYKETNYNASSNEGNSGCLIVPIIITSLTVLVAFFDLWSLIISLPITIVSWGFYSLFKDSDPNPERDISFIKNIFHCNLEHSFRCFKGGSHDYEDVIILLSQEDAEKLKSIGKTIPDNYQCDDSNRHIIKVVLHGDVPSEFLGSTKLDTEDFKALAEKVHNDNCILFWEKDFEETNTCGMWSKIFVDFDKKYARRTITVF